MSTAHARTAAPHAMVGNHRFFPFKRVVMKKSIGSVFLLLVLAGAVPISAHAQPVAESAFGFSNVIGPTINFGSVPVGTAQPIDVSGTNNTPMSLSVFAALGGPDAGDFSIVNRCIGVNVIAQATCTGVIVFTPRSPGPKNAELLVVMRSVVEAAADQPPELRNSNAVVGAPSGNAFVRMETWPLAGVGR